MKYGSLDRRRDAAAVKLRLAIDAWLDEVKLTRSLATDVIAEVAYSYVRAGLRGEDYPPTRAEQLTAVDRDLAEHGVDHFFPENDENERNR